MNDKPQAPAELILIQCCTNVRLVKVFVPEQFACRITATHRIISCRTADCGMRTVDQELDILCSTRSDDSREDMWMLNGESKVSGWFITTE